MEDAKTLKRAAVQYLTGLQQSGLTDLPKSSSNHEHDAGREPPEPVDVHAVKPMPPTDQEAAEHAMVADIKTKSSTPISTRSLFGDAVDGEGLGYGLALPLKQRQAQLELLNKQVAACTKCSELVDNRTQTVFGVGNAQPRLCFLGEGPGADEDRLGEPFVGRAGQLLNKIIEACQMRREDVYILNTVKCRPPGNRNPQETELTNCWPYAVKQLEILQPEFICCLGSIAAQTILQSKESVGRMRGQFFQYRSSRVMVTYHPAYLLRNPAAKSKTWDDMRMLMSAMGIEYQKRRES